MKTIDIATVLYILSLDMDYSSRLDSAQTEIEAIKEEIESLEDSSLFHCLDRIALDYDHLLNNNIL